jgi:RES domain-containing protein
MHLLEAAPLLEPAHLLRVVGLRAARGLDGRFFRAVLGVDPLDTSETRQLGGRYNPRWEFEALYCSWSRELCLKEQAAHSGSAPSRVVPLDARLDRVLDLTDPFLRTSLLLRETDLTGEDEELTQRIGRVARDAGFEGLLVPAVHGGRNLVVFLDRLSSRSYVSAFEDMLRPTG